MRSNVDFLLFKNMILKFFGVGVLKIVLKAMKLSTNTYGMCTTFSNPQQKIVGKEGEIDQIQA